MCYDCFCENFKPGNLIIKRSSNMLEMKLKNFRGLGLTLCSRYILKTSEEYIMNQLGRGMRRNIGKFLLETLHLGDLFYLES